MNISAIVALDARNGIGKNGTIPWHIPGEQKRFKEITTPHPMIMGRKTFESIGKVLPNRPHIIVTRDSQYHVEGASVVNSLEKAIEVAKKMDKEEIFIIGGGEIFAKSVPYLTKLYLTIIQNDFQCDTFFPDYSLFTKITSKEEKTDWGYPYTFLTLER